MKNVRWLVFVVLLVFVNMAFAATVPRIPGEYNICGIKVKDKFSNAVKMFGPKFVQEEFPFGDENDFESIIYNDPRLAVHLIIGCDSSIFPGIKNAKISCITLKKGFYKGKKNHLAVKSFANLGTPQGVKLGDSKQTVKKIYPKTTFFETKNEYGKHLRDSSSFSIINDGQESYSYHFNFEKGKVVEISLLYYK